MYQQCLAHVYKCQCLLVIFNMFKTIMPLENINYKENCIKSTFTSTILAYFSIKTYIRGFYQQRFRQVLTLVPIDFFPLCNVLWGHGNTGYLYRLISALTGTSLARFP